MYAHNYLLGTDNIVLDNHSYNASRVDYVATQKCVSLKIVKYHLSTFGTYKDVTVLKHKYL